MEVTAAGGLRIICNNEEERFSGRKHASTYPSASLEALKEIMKDLGIGPDRIVAWLATYDYPLFIATGVRSLLEEFPASLGLVFQDHRPTFDRKHLKEGICAPARLGSLFGLDSAVPIIGMSAPRQSRMVLIFGLAVRTRSAAGDDRCRRRFGRFRLDLALFGRERNSGDSHKWQHFRLARNILQRHQLDAGRLDTLSSEGRYMGAAAYGEMNRSTNRFYPQLRKIFGLSPDGNVYLNRSLANWPRNLLRKPYTPELIGILGSPIAPEDMWNPDAVLRVEDIRHQPNTQDRLDKAAATQMVFEDALIHIIDCLIRTTGSDRLVLTGGAALNALANMRLLEHFDAGYYERVLKRSTQLHLWVPPMPGDAGVTVGAAYAFAAAGAGFGTPLKHAFYCGCGPSMSEIVAALKTPPT